MAAAPNKHAQEGALWGVSMPIPSIQITTIPLDQLSPAETRAYDLGYARRGLDDLIQQAMDTLSVTSHEALSAVAIDPSYLDGHDLALALRDLSEPDVAEALSIALDDWDRALARQQAGR
jgi:hypothetical protein